MDEVTEEDLTRLMRQQSRQIDMLKYEVEILRAQNQLLREIIVEALQGKEMRPNFYREPVYTDDDHKTDDT